MILVRNENLLLAVIFGLSIFQLVLSSGLIEVFQWKQMDFYNRGDNGFNGGRGRNPGRVVFPNRERLRRAQPVVTSRDQPINTISRWGGRDEPSSNTSSYIAYNNVPMGATHFNGRLFITMPRRRIGIPSTLNYIDMKAEGNNPSPKLKAYPNFETNYLDPNLKPDTNRLVSVYRTTVDECKRLWFIDTGMLEYPGNRMQIQRPTIWVIDLLTDRVVKRFEIPQTVVDTGRGLASITIDVSPNKCDEAFAYIPDLVNNVLDVYSFKTNRMWTFQHNYFKFDPLGGDLNIGGQTFRWDDGIFSIALGPNLPNGYRQAFFHAMASTNEFMVSTEVLQNEANAQRDDHGNDFTILGNRGSKRQSTMHEYDAKTGVVFYSEIHRNAVGCWNTNKEFSAENHGTVAEDAQRMIYPSDLTIDNQGTMWIMTNSMPIFIYSNLDPNVVNFRVWKQNVVTAAENTVCE